MELPKRNFISENKQIDLNVKYKQKGDFKPIGLWYSCYSSWYNWVTENMNQGLEKYIHKLNLNYGVLTTINNKNPNKILVINNLIDFNKFELEYLQPCQFINWHKVSKNYGGIEICPYFISKRTTLWYHPMGCS